MKEQATFTLGTYSYLDANAFVLLLSSTLIPTVFLQCGTATSTQSSQYYYYYYFHAALQ